MYIPYAEIREPFYAWYDGNSGSSRIDYYGGILENNLYIFIHYLSIFYLDIDYILYVCMYVYIYTNTQHI